MDDYELFFKGDGSMIILREIGDICFCLTYSWTHKCYSVETLTRAEIAEYCTKWEDGYEEAFEPKIMRENLSIRGLV